MKLALFATACVVAAAAPPLSTRASGTANNWTYKAGDKKLVGPPKWGKAYPTCAGKKQSPIDITDVTDAETTLPLEFGGSCSEYNVTQHYDAFKAEVQGGSCAVQYANTSFSFAQVHFHAPSEHTISGEHFDAEAHFVHLSKDGQAVVVGVFLQRSDEERDDDDISDNSKEERASGDDSSEDSEEERASAYGAGQSASAAEPFFAQFLEALAKVKEDTSVPVTLGSFHAGVQKLFSEGNVFSYPGGLTTPPCSEIVTWFVLETPITISHKEYESITESLKRIEAANDGENARPTQPLNGREVLSY